MVKQIVILLRSELEGHIDLDEKIVDEYVEEAYKEIEFTETMFKEVEAVISRDVKRTFYKGIKGDEEKVKIYSQILTDFLSSKHKHIKKKVKTPPWEEVIQTLEGKNFQSFIRRRSVTYTLELLNKEGIVSLL
jgi:hypothetical protein